MRVIMITGLFSLKLFRFTVNVLLAMAIGVFGSAWIEAQEQSRQRPEANSSFEKWLNEDVAFVITEEAGAREGLHTALGSAAVAAIIYEIIRWEALQLTFFVYPELLFAVAALQVLLGRYTGYRLSEFARFRAFGRK